MKVENMKSTQGNKVPNQFLIYADDGVYFQSYQTIIAFKSLDGTVKLDQNRWDYSRTTGKYRNIFLNEDKATTEQKIKAGDYILTDLN